MAIKELKTRIALKYDSYSAWTTAPGKDLVLLAGELGICYIGDTNPESNVVPTVLFKVGDGTKTFENLPWASAKAADVYSWAKASDVVYNQAAKTITFVKGNADGTDKVITFNYVTLAEVQAITNGLDTRITALEGKFTGTGSIQGQIDALDGRLDVIEGEAAGSIKKAEADAKAYAKDYADGLAGNYDAAGSAAAAESAAKSYADGEFTKDRNRISNLETADAAQDTLIAGKLDASVYNAYIEGKAMSDAELKSYADGKAVEEAGKAQTAAVTSANSYTDEKVQALANGQVATNTTDIAGLTTRIGNEETARANADTALSNRLEKVEAFFEGAYTEDGQPVKEALDTLVEIQTYITNDGTAAEEVVRRIGANETAITALQDIVKDGGTLEVRVDDAQTRVAAVEPKVSTLESIAKSYLTGGEDAVKKAIDAVSVRAEKGITDAATAQSAAEAAASAASVADGKAVDAQTRVGVLENTTVPGVKTIAEDAQTRVGAVETRIGTAEGKITTAEGNITTLQSIVSTGADSNANLRSAITDLQTLTGTNGAIRQEIADAKKAGTDAAAAVDALSKGQVDTNKTDIANIKADYLKAADEFIFNCGTATTITHKAEA